jgi:hypothetical protein
MITIKSTATKAESGAEASTVIAGTGIKKPSDTYNELKPNDPEACPTGTCSDIAGLGTSLSNASSALSSLESNSLWGSLVCGSPIKNISTNIDVKSDLDTSAMWLRSTNCTVQGLVNLLKVDNGNISLDKVEIQKRLDSSLNASLNNISKLTKSQITNIMASRLGTEPSVLKATIGGAEIILEASKANDAKSFTELLKKATGSTEIIEFLDLEAEAAILDHLLDQAIQLGIPQAIDIILDKIEDDNLKRKSILRNIRTSAIYSELNYIQKAIEYIGSDGVLFKVPDIIILICRYYTLPKRTLSSEYDDKLDYLLDTLNLISPTWMNSYRNGTLVSNLAPFTNASSDCEKLFMRRELTKTNMMISKKYRKKSILEVSSFNYKNISNI